MPIPENAVKELLSRGFLRLVAGQAGFVTCTDELDFGVDLSLRHVDYVEENGRIGFRASGFKALLATSDPIHPLFRLALIVVHETGHRIGAVRLLRWADIDFERQLVRWRGGNDKIGFEHETWLTLEAVEALQAARRSQAVISEWVFPAPSELTRPVSRHLLRDWWERGQKLAKLPAEPGRGWHSLRRQFATEMKYAP